MRRTLFLAVVGGLLMAPIPAAAQPGAQYTRCEINGTFTSEPGLTLTPQRTELVLTATLAPCESSDPSLTSGEAIATAVADPGTCQGGPVAGEATIVWNNGHTTSFDWSGSAWGPIAEARADITRGTQFVGGTFLGSLVFDMPEDPAACAEADGLAGVTFTGIDQFIGGSIPEGPAESSAPAAPGATRDDNDSPAQPDAADALAAPAAPAQPLAATGGGLGAAALFLLAAATAVRRRRF